MFYCFSLCEMLQRLSSMRFPRSIHTSAIVCGKRKTEARKIKKSNMAFKIARDKMLTETHPDPFTGVGIGRESKWESSELNSVIYKPEEVWGRHLGIPARRARKGMPTPVVPLPAIPTNADTPMTLSNPPNSLNFQLSSNKKFLFEMLPQVDAQEGSLEVSNSKKQMLERLVDLRNASSKGIHVANRQKIIDHFKINQDDTSSPEVVGELY